MPKLTHTHTKKTLLFFSSSAALSASRIAFIRWRSFKALTSSPRFGFQRCPANEILVHSPSNPASQSLHTVPYHSCYRYFTGCPCFSLLFFFLSSAFKYRAPQLFLFLTTTNPIHLPSNSKSCFGYFFTNCLRILINFLLHLHTSD